MLFWLSNFADAIPLFNVFRYITFRTGGAVVTAMLFVFLFGPMIIRGLRSARAGDNRSVKMDRRAICSPKRARQRWAA